MGSKVGKIAIDDVFVREERILLPLMVERSMSISSNNSGNGIGRALFEHRKAGGQSPVVHVYSCSESWDVPFEAAYGFNPKVNRVFKGEGGIANQAVELVYDENEGKQKLVPKAGLVYFLKHLAHGSEGRVLQVYITGHTDCGGIKAVQGSYSGEDLALRKKLDALKVAVSGKMEELKGKDIPHNVKNAILAEANVDFQVSQVIGYGRELFEKGQLLVAGFMRDIDGTYGSRFGDCYLININGETNPERMRTNAYLKALPENMLSEKVRRME